MSDEELRLELVNDIELLVNMSGMDYKTCEEYLVTVVKGFIQ